MAGDKPGPAKGHGGRPRKKDKDEKPRKDGYVRVTIGPKGKGRQVYLHRKLAGVVNAGKNVTVDHKDANEKHNVKSNLEVVSRSENTRRRNERHARLGRRKKTPRHGKD